MNYKFGSFKINILDNWEADLEQTPIIIYKKNDAVGVVQISLFSIDVTLNIDMFDEFYDFITDCINVPVNNDWAKNVKQVKDDFLLYEANDISNDRYFLFAFCKNKQSVMFITYNCIIEDANLEKQDVLKMLENIEFLKD